MFGVGVFVMLGFFMLQVIGGMIRREPAALSRAALGLAKSILGSFVALALLATALEITDQLCIGIVNAAGTNMNEMRSEEHTSELQSLMRNSYAVFCLKKKKSTSSKRQKHET